MSQFTKYEAVHENPKGPGDQRPTALQIINDYDLTGRWSDKVILITGCSSGIGIETARALKETGAKIYATARSLEKGQSQLGNILEPGRVELLELRLDSLASIRACAKEFQSKETKLNILINNAGVMAVAEHRFTEDGFETQFGTNHLGHFLLFQLLKPQLLAASTPEFNSRVVSVSSLGHRISPLLLDDLNLSTPGKYEPFVAYGNSKTANIYFANEIERRYGPEGIHGHSLHPGGISTGLQQHLQHLPPDQLEMMKRVESDPRILKIMKNAEQGEATSVWAAVAPEWEGTGGKFLDDYQISKPVAPGEWIEGPVHADYIYDEDKAKKLWEASCEMVGVADD